MILLAELHAYHLRMTYTTASRLLRICFIKMNTFTIGARRSPNAA